MRSQYKRIIQTTTIASLVFITSGSATFVLLDIFMPRFDTQTKIVKVVVPIVHEAIPTVSVSLPVELRIATISVAATVNPVGLTPLGDMDINDNAEQVAWYKLGPKPGEEGSAVIAGHYGWKDGKGSVFNSLNTLKKGDEIATIGENGEVVRFSITRIATYHPDQDATDVFKSDDGKAHLNLITCKGTWINTQSTYSDRLVVFSDRAV
ncbi:MAG: class F sortase [Candidatus Saccharimonadaceae bacterium]